MTQRLLLVCFPARGPRLRGDGKSLNSLRSLNDSAGFTLIELSIVLVIIGLIVGGILVGQDLIKSAQVRGQLTQIEKFNSAINTFKGKFGELPGDMTASTASKFGFAARGLYPGEGDGNGIIEGNDCNANVGRGCTSGLIEGAGETAMVWVDLSSAVAGNLIEGSFNTANSTTLAGSDVPASGVGNYLPEAKIGNGNYLYVWSGGQGNIGGAGNFFGLVKANGILSSSAFGVVDAYANIPVAQAYNMDKKADDGLPVSGNITAAYARGGYTWSANNTTDNSTTCFNTTNNTYSISSLASYGTGGNCALSFRLQ